MTDLPDISGKIVRSIATVRNASRNHNVKLIITFTDGTRLEVTPTHFVSGLVVDKRP